ATSRSVMYLFMIQGVIIGVIGLALGTILGTGFCYLANSRHWIKLPVGAYALDYLPFHASAAALVLVAVLTPAISFLSALFSSGTEGRMGPVEAVGYE